MSTNQNNLQLAVSKVPDDVRSTLKIAQQRFCFNVHLIEEKYCKKSSGIVYNTKSEEFEFDENLCTLTDDESLTKAIDSQRKALFGTEFGSSILSSPAVAPEDSPRDERRIMKINKLFRALNEPKPYARCSPLSSLPSISTSEVQKSERRSSLRLSSGRAHQQLAICSAEKVSARVLRNRSVPSAVKLELSGPVLKNDEDNALMSLEDSWKSLEDECAAATTK